MKVFITGANGLLATHTIMALLQKGYEVKGMLRDVNSFRAPQHPRLQLVQGSFTDYQTVLQALSGCSYIIHIAALTAQHIPRYHDYHNINVAGTDTILKAANTAGIKRMVYVSTANTFGHGSLLQPGNETLPARAPFAASHYAASKLEAQNLVLKNHGNVEVVIANPTFMLGAYAARPGSGRIVLMGLGKRIVFYPSGGKNFIGAADAANGLVRILEAGRHGEAYLLANENMSYREFFLKLAAHNKRKTLLVKIPDRVLWLMGLAGDALRKLNIRTGLSSVNMKILTTHNYYANEKAVTELGIRLSPVDESISETVAWFQQNAHHTGK